MNIIKFIEEFPDEESCRSDFRMQREQAGVICKKCSKSNHYWLPSKQQWQCKICGFRTTLRSGTMMQHSKLSFRYWYLTLAFMSFSKKGISALELQRQLDHPYYEPIWAMMHKIRRAMGQRDSLYSLDDMIEYDEGFFPIATPIMNQQLKRGKGSQKQKNVAG